MTFSLFAADPGVQTKYFGHMKTDADLEKHGVRVMNAIGAMVRAILDEDDAKLIGKIHEVSNIIQCISWIALSNDFTQITRNHHPRGINRPLFEFVLDVVLDYLGGALGPHLSKVWDEMIIFFFILDYFIALKRSQN